MHELDRVLRRIDEDLTTSVERLFALLRIESISTDPAYRDRCRAAADWLASELTALDFDAAARPTGGHPMVVGHDRAHAGNPPAGNPRGSNPHVLFYGHY